MSRSPSHENCPFGPDGGGYSPEPEAQFAPGLNADLDGTFKALAAALEAVPDPVAAAVAALTAVDVRTVLEALSIKDRAAVLRPLGLKLAPRKVGPAMARDALNRMRRAGRHDRRHAACSLGWVVAADLMMLALGSQEHATIAATRVEGWGPAVARTGLWANGQTSALGARVWVWASTQPWFAPEGASSEELAAVVIAAQAVIQATPEFEFSPNQDDDDDDHDAAATATALLAEIFGDAEPVGSAEAAGLVVGAGAANPGDAVDRTPADLDEFAAAVANLEGALHDAAEIASAVAANLGSGRPPAMADLVALWAPRADFDKLAAALRAAGVDFAEDSTASMGAAIETALEAARQDAGDQPIRDGLARVSVLRAPAGADALATLLSSATKRADELLATAGWSAPQRAEADALTALADLAGEGVSAADVFALQGKVVAARPDLAMLAISAAALRGPAPEAPQTTKDVETAKALVEASTPAQDTTPATEPAPAATAATSVATPTPKAVTPTKDTTPTPKEVTPTKDTTPTVKAVAVTKDATHPTPATTEQATLTLTIEAQTAPTDEPAPEADVAGAVASLVATGRHALASALTAASTQPALVGLDVDVLAVSALAAAVRGTASPTATELRKQISNLDSGRIQTDTASLLLTTTALLRTALVTGEPSAGAVLVELEPHLEAYLGTLASEVGRRALQGVLIGAPPLTTLADATDVEAAMAQVRQDAQNLLSRPRKLRFKRASDIATSWFAPDGIIGAALTVVATDDRAGADTVADALNLLTDPAEMSDEIDARDREKRSGSSNPLQGPARGDLLNAAAEAISPLAAWTEAATSLSRRTRSAAWSSTEVSQMRAAVLESAPKALAGLKSTTASPDRFAAAAAAAAAASLTQTVALLAGDTTLSTIELAPTDALGLDVLHVASSRVDPLSGNVTMPSGVADTELVAATTRSWEDAVRLHLAAENFAAAHHLVSADRAQMLTGPGGPQLSSAVVALVATSETSARTELDAARANLGAELRTARANNQITEEQDAELTALLKDTRREGADLAGVRATLEAIGETLPHYSQRATTRLRERLERASAEHRVSEGDVARVDRFIDGGDLATAEELIYLLETNEDLPSPHQHNDLARFFPSVPDALPSGITVALVDMARRGGVDPQCPALDFSGLSPDQAQLTATALASWVELGATPPAERLRVSESSLLLPAMRMVGIEGMKVDQLHDLPRGRDRRFVDIRDVTVNGKAMVPAFGSKLGDRRRVMLAWGQPSAETLMSYVDQDPSGESVIVAYFGTMSAQVRADLSVRALRSSASVIVLDDAALAYLASRGARLMDATMRVLLPFANVNPYIRQKRGLVAPEMFYGRNDERRQVLDPDGTQIIYGGRGLGKSALLRDAEAKFQTQGQGGEQLALYLSLDDIGGDGPRSADAVWDTLLEHLIDRKVIVAKRSGRGSRSPHKQVVAGISAWLKESASRRLLILLDESDRFFESDAPTFVETSNLRNLGVETKGRAKVVFAGLHSVQRFTKVAGNGPFSHLAQRPTVIGPLKPQYALNLLTDPMAALGYEFAEQDLVNRVLAYCSYQPFLLQMFGHRLVERMHEQRAAQGAGRAVPYVVTRTDIDTVQGNADLREDISNAFRETLHLDPRYNVIANVVAKQAHEFGLDARLSDSELREECLGWWEEGFATLDVEAFRSYLSEMVGLGVLARNSDGRGWRLRGPSVLDMVGLPSEVETQLLGADTESLREEFVALETRIALADGRWSPLTAAQLDDVLGDHTNQIRVILGSEATGIDMAAAGVRAATDIGARFTIPNIPNRGAFAAELTGGAPGTRRVVLSDLRTNTCDVCVNSLDSAIASTPDRAGVTRSVALVAAAQQMGFWREVFSRQEDTPALGTVALRRYDKRTLKVWTMLAEKFRTPARAARLLAVTGGWPVLVERAAQQAGTASLEASTLNKLETHLATAAGAAELVDLVGVCADPDLARAYRDLVDVLGDGDADLADLHVAVSEATADSEVVVACLLALGVFTPDGSGRFRLEPVLAAAWARRL